jgi:ElaB/YqjD/DUF883 family membrane-anchored ribosome-binding protein
MIDRLQGAGLGAGLPDQEMIKERAMEMAATAREQLADGSERVRRYVVEQPARALGIALGMGVLLGWLIKRR